MSKIGENDGKRSKGQRKGEPSGVNKTELPAEGKGGKADDVSNKFPNFSVLTEEERLVFFEALTAARKNVESRGVPTRDRFGTVHDQYLEFFDKKDDERTPHEPNPLAFDESNSFRQDCSALDAGEPTDTPEEGSPSPSLLPEGDSDRPPREKSLEIPEPILRTECESVIQRDTNKVVDLYLKRKRRNEAKSNGFLGSNEGWKTYRVRKKPKDGKKENVWTLAASAGKRPASRDTPRFDALNAEEKEVFFRVLEDARNNVVGGNRGKNNEVLSMDAIVRRYRGDRRVVGSVRPPEKPAERKKNLRVKVTLTSGDNERMAKATCPDASDSESVILHEEDLDVGERVKPKTTTTTTTKTPAERECDGDNRKREEKVRTKGPGGKCKDASEAADTCKQQTGKVAERKTQRAEREERGKSVGGKHKVAAEMTDINTKQAKKRKTQRGETEEIGKCVGEKYKEASEMTENRQQTEKMQERETQRAEREGKEKCVREKYKDASETAENTEKVIERKKERAEMQRKATCFGQKYKDASEVTEQTEKVIEGKTQRAEMVERGNCAGEKYKDASEMTEQTEKVMEGKTQRVEREGKEKCVGEKHKDASEMTENRQQTPKVVERKTEREAKCFGEKYKDASEMTEYRQQTPKVVERKTEREAKCFGGKYKDASEMTEQTEKVIEGKTQRVETQERGNCAGEKYTDASETTENTEKVTERRKQRGEMERKATCFEEKYKDASEMTENTEPTGKVMERKIQWVETEERGRCIGERYRDASEMTEDTEQTEKMRERKTQGAETREKKEVEPSLCDVGKASKGTQIDESPPEEDAPESNKRKERRKSWLTKKKKKSGKDAKSENPRESPSEESSEDEEELSEREREKLRRLEGRLLARLNGEASAEEKREGGTRVTHVASVLMEKSEGTGESPGEDAERGGDGSTETAREGEEGQTSAEARRDDDGGEEERRFSGKVMIVDDGVIEKVRNLIYYLEEKTKKDGRLEKEYMKLLVDYVHYLSKVMESLVLRKERHQRVQHAFPAGQVQLKFHDAKNLANGKTPPARSVSVENVGSTSLLQMSKEDADGAKEKAAGGEKGSGGMIFISSDSDSSVEVKEEVGMAMARSATPTVVTTKVRLLQDLLRQRAEFVEGSTEDFRIVQLPDREYVPAEKPPTVKLVKEDEEDTSRGDGKLFKALLRCFSCGKKKVEEEEIFQNLKGEAVRVDVFEGKGKDPDNATLNQSTMEVLKAAGRKRIIEKYYGEN